MSKTPCGSIEPLPWPANDEIDALRGGLPFGSRILPWILAARATWMRIGPGAPCVVSISCMTEAKPFARTSTA
jgi:hypothetical protein